MYVGALLLKLRADNVPDCPSYILYEKHENDNNTELHLYLQSKYFNVKISLQPQNNPHSFFQEEPGGMHNILNPHVFYRRWCQCVYLWVFPHRKVK